MMLGSCLHCFCLERDVSGTKGPQHSLLQRPSQRAALSTIAAASQNFVELRHRDDGSGQFKTSQPQRRSKQSPAPSSYRKAIVDQCHDELVWAKGASGG